MPDLDPILQQILAVDWAALGLALVLSGAIGLEREMHGRPAGIRTHMLVCVCSCALMLSSRSLAPLHVSGATVVFDPQRLAAGIVTGIGFLGAAAVVRAGDIVRGLTTGASIWCVAGLGVVLGQESYGLAIVVTVCYLFVLVVLDWLPRGLGTVVYRRLRVRGRGDSVSRVIEEIRPLLRIHRMRLQEVAGTVDLGDPEFEVTLHVRCRDPLRTPDVLEGVARLEGVSSVRWLTEHRG